MIRALRAGLVVCLGWATTASAAPTVVSDDDVRWQLDLPDSWSPGERDDLEIGKALAVWTSGRRRFVLLRLRGNTDGAYDGKPAFWSGLEDGVRKDAPDFRRLSGTVKKLGKKKKVPGYDLWYRIAGGVRGVRFIFLRNYCLMGTIDLPGERSVPRDVRRVLESLGPAP